MAMKLKKPELMAPAGYWPQLIAAIEAGADAVYFGLNHFSARAKVGFEIDELEEVFRTLHRRGVKGFVTFNTLVFDDELAAAEKAISEIALANADAIIVQDIGIARLCRKVAPHLDVHGSTQMSVTSAQGAELARSFGCSRVVLARELALKDISKIVAATDVELETFVHGALCVSYSGQCFSSEAWGGRSANRGQCAQGCRLSYDLIVDGQEKELGEFRYLLSPGDLYALSQVPELIRQGISCLKIEGRYKDENYVALTTRAYREAIDRAMKEVGWDGCRDQGYVAGEVPTDKQSLEQVYSRGLGPHFMSGVNHQTVVDGRAPRHRGVKIGSVRRIALNQVVVESTLEKDALKPGDGIVFDAANWRSPEDKEEGGNVFGVESLGQDEFALSFGEGKVDFQRIRPGDLVWRTSDPAVNRSAKVLSSGRDVRMTRPITIEVDGREGSPLKLTAVFENPFDVQEAMVRVTVESSQNLQAARSSPLDEATLADQLGRLGGTPLHLVGLQNHLDDNLFLPVSTLNGSRRELVSKIEATMLDLASSASQEVGINVLDRCLKEFGAAVTGEDQPESVDSDLKVHVLIRSPAQLDAAISLQPGSITLDYLDLYGLRPAVEKIRASGVVPRVASPRILKPAEQNVAKFLLSLDCPLLVRSGGLLFDLLRLTSGGQNEWTGDFSLNTANHLSALTYLGMGLRRITPSHDLNAKQVAQLCLGTPPSRMEVVALQHMPVFHTEHCVFCRFLSDGTDHTNCGHPCEKHQVSLRDQKGRLHPVMADVGCRNTVFGGQAQWAGKHLQLWIDQGLRDFRIEFVHETAQQVSEIGKAFTNFAKGKTGYQQVGNLIGNTLPQGTTTGSLFVPREELVQIVTQK